MNPLLFSIATLVALATFSVLYFLTAIIRLWLRARWVKQHGIEGQACILKMEVVNEPGRYLAFIRLQLAVTSADGTSFISCADSFFQPLGFPDFTTDEIIYVKYHPADISQLQVVKKPQPVAAQTVVRWQPVPTSGYLSMVQ